MCENCVKHFSSKKVKQHIFFLYYITSCIYMYGILPEIGED